MSPINVNNNANQINWQTLLNAINGADPTKGTGEVSADNRTVNFSITEADGTTSTVAVTLPVDLDLPETVDSNAINSLCQKLANDKSMNLTDEQINQINKALNDTLSRIVSAKKAGPSASAATTASNVMFDLYKLLALLLEVSQKQRDSARDLRKAQSEMVQNSIQAQADEQRTAAMVSLIGGLACAGIQLFFSARTIQKQTSAMKTELNTLKTSGVDSAQKNLAMLETAVSPEKAQAQLVKVDSRIGGKQSTDQLTIREHVSSNFGNSGTKKIALNTSLNQLETHTAELRRFQNVNNEMTAADFPGSQKVQTAKAQLDTYMAEETEIQELEAKPRPLTDIQSNRLDELKAAHNPEALQTKQTALATAIDEARTAKTNELTNLVASDGQKVESARTEYRNAVKNDLAHFENEHKAAVNKRNAASESGATKEELAELDKDVNVTGQRLEYARALAYDKLAAKFGTNNQSITTEAERAMDINLASRRVDIATEFRKSDTAFLKAHAALSRGEAKLGLINALGSAGNNVVQSASSWIQSEATRTGAEQERQREQLEQTKELFNQAQDVIDSVSQLMQAINQAETQSMRDAIQA